MKDFKLTNKEHLSMTYGRVITDKLYAGMFCILNIVSMIVNGFNAVGLIISALLCGLWLFHNYRAEQLAMALTEPNKDGQ